MNSQNERQSLPAMHVGSFLLLMFIATFRPIAIWPNFPISLEPIAVLAIGLLLFYKIYLTIGFNSFYQKYKVELILLAAYFLVCFLSLYLNKFRYKDMQELLRYGITFIAITMSFPAAVFLFLLPQNKKRLSLSRFKYSGYLPWVYFALLAGMVIWQKMDFESAKKIGQFFVSSEIWPSKNFNGFFRARTDTGSILSLFVLTLIAFLAAMICTKQTIDKSFIIFFILLIVVSVFAGFQTGARVFILILLVPSIIYVFYLSRKSFKKAMLVLLVVISLFHLTIFFLDQEAVYKLSSFFNYLLPFSKGEIVFLSDMWPNFSQSAFGDRVVLWKQSIDLLKNNWILGVSNGGFRLSHENVFQNSHTLLLQIFIDSGIVGFSIIFYLAIRQVLLMKNNLIMLTFLICFVVSLLVDFQLDHSIPWIVSCAYLLVLVYKFNNFSFFQIKKYEIKSKYAWFLYGGIIFCLTPIIVYFYLFVSSHNRGLSLSDRLDHFIGARYFDSPILIDRTLNYVNKLKTKGKIHQFPLINKIDLSDNKECLYKYNNNNFIRKVENIYKLNDYDYFQYIHGGIAKYNSSNLMCTRFQYPTYQNVLNERWISDKSGYIYRSDRKSWSLWGNATISTSLFFPLKGFFEFRFKTKGQFGVNKWPRLVFKLMNMNGKIITKKSSIINTNRIEYRRFQFQINKNESTVPLYISLSYINEARDLKKQEDRNVWLYPKSFEIIKIK